MNKAGEILLSLAHIGTVVSDADAVSRGLLAGLGLPWTTREFKWKAEEMIMGKPGHSICNIHDLGGGVTMETIQPLDKDSYWARFLVEKKGGLNHLCFKVAEGDFDRVVGIVRGLGWKGLVGSVYQGRRWLYFETKPGGLIIELIEPPRS